MKTRKIVTNYLYILIFLQINLYFCSKLEKTSDTDKYFKKSAFRLNTASKKHTKKKLNLEKQLNLPKIKLSKVQRTLSDSSFVKRGNVKFLQSNGDISIHRELMVPGAPKRANDLKLHLGSAIGGLLSVKFPDVPAPVFIKQNPFYSFI